MIVYDKRTEEKIKKINRELDPFYIVDLQNGKFSLCARINYMDEEFGWASFETYAVEIGEDPHDEQGYVNYGSGYDWAAAFKEAFKDDPSIRRITFDCESCGFFCDGDDLDMMVDFGKRFRALCQDTEKFTPIVSAGIKNEAERQAEEEILRHTVRGHIMSEPLAEFCLRNSYGTFVVQRGEGKLLLDGAKITVSSVMGDMYMDAEEFLDQKVSASQQDLFEEDVFKLLVESEQEKILSPTMGM